LGEVLHDHVLQILLAAKGPVTYPDVVVQVEEDGCIAAPGQVFDALKAMHASGKVSAHNNGTVEVFAAIVNDQPSPADPLVDASITEALDVLFEAFGKTDGAALSTFLDTVRASGVSDVDAHVGIYIARELALRMTTKMGNDKLRAPLFKVVRILEAVRAALA
jgi:hypothetical protein